MLSFTFRYFTVVAVILIIYPSVILSQPPPGRARDFYERYHEVYTEVFARDAKEAMRLADSLNRVAETNVERMQVNMLISICYRSMGDMSSAILTAMEGQQMAEEDGALEMRAGSSGFLANNFMIVGLLEEAKVHLDKADKLQETLKGTPRYYMVKSALLQDRARIALEEENYTQAIGFLEEGAKLVVQDTTNPIGVQLSLAANNQLLGICYMHIGDFDKSDSLLRMAEANLKGQENKIRPYIYRAMAESALERHQLDTAKHYVALMQPYLGLPDGQEDRKMMYDFFARYYKAIGENGQSVRYSQMLHEVVDARQKNAQRIWNDVLMRLNAENKTYKNQVSNIWWITGAAALLGLAVLIFLWRRRRDEKRKYLELIEKLKLQDAVGKPETLPIIARDEGADQERRELLISADTEKRLLNELIALEETAFFLDKNISLASLSIRLNTNQRYVSYIVRKYRGKDFNAYVQHLRIHYIMNRIRLEPELLDYKLSYLADLAGFSNHSKFSSVFKAVTGIPPSVFIHYTREESKKDLVS